MAITADRVKALLHYDPLTGYLTWRVQRGRVKVGSLAGCTHPEGYIVIRVDSKKYLAHRLIWLYMTRKFPENDIDLRNRCRTDNSWSNLREATISENLCNTGAKRNNSSGFKGVSYQKNMNKWSSEISVKGVRYKLGYFDIPEEAYKEYCDAAKRLHGEFVNTGGQE